VGRLRSLPGIVLLLALLLGAVAGEARQDPQSSAEEPAPEGQSSESEASQAPSEAAPSEESNLPDVRIHNPKLFDKSAKAAQAALTYYGEYDAPEERERLHEIGYRLAAQARWNAFPFSFYLVDMPVPNAFALPGGHVFVTRGMLDLGLNDDMLACLLGHEIAHVVYEHGIKMQKRATLLNILSQAALLGVMIGADSEPANPRDPYGIERSDSRKGSLVQGTAATGIVFTELLLRKFSRGFEDEADIEGQRLAAAAGFDPIGAHDLWRLMNERLPTSDNYGYWRTHPFSELRLRAAEVRAGELGIRDPKPSADYRRAVQAAILDHGNDLDEEKAFEKPFEDASEEKRERGPTIEPAELDRRPPVPWQDGYRPFLERSALDAWPRGPEAERIRLAELERVKKRELERDPIARDYGRLVRAYEGHLEAVRQVDPESSLVARLEGEIAELRQESESLYPEALEVWKEGFYQTPFLLVFLSNYPDSEVAPEAALALGNAFSRMRRESDAVELYLQAMESDPESEAASRALAGLRNLTPYLDDLVALGQLAETGGDEELARLARARLDEQADRFERLENGSRFLRRYPDDSRAGQVKERLEKLAQNLYGEVVLYQSLGDHVKALERIQAILEHAPLTPAADALREKALLDA
jgi:predicted Zn-dependent protease